MGWTLADLRRKARTLIGLEDTETMSVARLDEYINNAYQFVMPSDTKMDRQHTYYTFNTAPNTQTYALPNATFTNFEPPFTLNGQELNWYQDPELFSYYNSEQYPRMSLGTGDAVVVTFALTLTSIPVFPTSVIVTDNVEVFTDAGAGVLAGDLGGAGTINYVTGAISVTFAGAPALGTDIAASWITHQIGTPQSVLLYNNVFTLDPIPSTVYRCKIKAYGVPIALTAAIDVPLLEEWGPAIAYCAARDVFSDNGQMDRYQEIDMLYKKEIDSILTRTAQNLLNVRASPSF